MLVRACPVGDGVSNGGIAQLVEHPVHTRVVICSSQIAATRPVGQVVKTPPFHGGNMGSSPVRVTNKKTAARLFFCWNDVFRCAERDVSFGRDVRSAHDVCLRQVKRNTAHHFAPKPQNITPPQARHHLPVRAIITFSGTQPESYSLPIPILTACGAASIIKLANDTS